MLSVSEPFIYQRKVPPYVGYFAGGQTGSVAVSTTEGLNFSSDTLTQVTKGALTTALAGKQGGNSAFIAYFSGGGSGVAIGGSTVTDGLTFATDTTAQVTKGALTTNCGTGGGVNSSTLMYSCAGYKGGTASSNIVTTNNGLTFATDTTTQVTKGVLATATAESPGANSSSKGYFGGGYTGNFVVVSVTEGLDFSSDTSTMVTKGALGTTLHRAGAVNSTTLAYFAGGASAGAGSTQQSVNYGLTFATDTTTQVTKGALTTARGGIGGANSSSFGYFSGGQNSAGTTLATNDRLDFSSDTTTMVTKGALATATWTPAGAQGSPSGIQIL